MKKSTLAMIGLAVGIPLVWGGLQVRQAVICSGLEEDYLNLVSNLKSTVQTRSLLRQTGKSDPVFDGIIKDYEARLPVAITEIYEKCGERAAQTANRKASDVLL